MIVFLNTEPHQHVNSLTADSGFGVGGFPSGDINVGMFLQGLEYDELDLHLIICINDDNYHKKYICG